MDICYTGLKIYWGNGQKNNARVFGEKINASAVKQKEGEDMLRVTPEAIAKLKETMEYPKQDILRIFIAGAG
ncbi:MULTISPECIES: hypothetical protein [Aneurinibacillus]|uniref:Uncharacterized protein n=1 Tax=Aneurinibacillus thermoaerophilus TaxID=143495 RepID=A0A1G8DID5_ANETH|nr:MULTISPECIES: hypothetical protein [Aneurinibacillus]AMA74357.1 hypothetical protein ACH33_17095 [Aneurinibacillus sp. XH2]MED0674200.1 hypothetical protein [Aneurinibacillus thermoaerophilus]MED0678764.1 hypothetical protein [Aneurinibacillus thermoaerophilus]MED0736753.1 hypothetical protein [Aneurinibacillus thermoaerophilus]MED0758275.1 hypothetical protein [Aneurinibacillus thermoaerophilus]